jgi:5'-3' exonuclease
MDKLLVFDASHLTYRMHYQAKNILTKDNKGEWSHELNQYVLDEVLLNHMTAYLVLNSIFSILSKNKDRKCLFLYDSKGSTSVRKLLNIN